MEPLLEHFMCFPAAPVCSLSAAAPFASLPRRRHVYLGETVQVLLVLRSRGGPAAPPWGGPAGSLFALASVCDAGSPQRSAGREPPDLRDSGGEEPGAGEPRFRACSPLLNKVSPAGGEQLRPGESVLVLDDQLVFCLTVSLDKLPVNTRRAKVVVTVWRDGEDRGQLLEHGYLTLLQLQSPTHTFHQDGSVFKTQVSTTLDVLPPPSVRCQQMTVSGRYLTVLKVLNHSQEDMCVQDVKILPNYNSSYLPMMPDGSVLIVDNVCHQSAEVTTASFCRINSRSSTLPSMLCALEEHNFLFQLELQDQMDQDSSEGLEMKLLAVLQWNTPTLPLTRYISTCYSLPSIWLDRPRLVMTASCPRTVRPLETFWVKYTLINDLQDFLAVRLMWNSEGGEEDPGGPAVVCRSPLSDLGGCRRGSSLSITLTFQILRSGLYELSQHMKVKFRFSVSAPPPAVRPPDTWHSAPRWCTSRSDHGGPAQCPEHSTVLVGKVAKRECKVLVL